MTTTTQKKTKRKENIFLKRIQKKSCLKTKKKNQEKLKNENSLHSRFRSYSYVIGLFIYILSV